MLFIAVDDLRPELNCYGAAHIHSPNLDKLAATGFLFSRAYCQQAVCGAVACIAANRHAVGQLWGDQQSRPFSRRGCPMSSRLPQHFLQQGYHTEGMGKLFHATMPDSHDFNDEVAWTVEYRYPESGPLTWRDPKNAELVERTGRRGPPWESPDVLDGRLLRRPTCRNGNRGTQAVEGSRQTVLLRRWFSEAAPAVLAHRRNTGTSTMRKSFGCHPLPSGPKARPITPTGNSVSFARIRAHRRAGR